MTLTKAISLARAMAQAAAVNAEAPGSTVAKLVEAALGLVEKWRSDGRTPEEILAAITKLRALKLDEIDAQIDAALARLPGEPPANPY